MDTSTAEPKIYPVKNNQSDYTLSSLTGLSIGIVTFLFGLLLASIKIAGIHVIEIFQGNFQFHGDPSLLYTSLFFISATMLLLVQYHFSDHEEEEEEELDSLK